MVITGMRSASSRSCSVSIIGLISTSVEQRSRSRLCTAAGSGRVLVVALSTRS